MSTPSFRIGFGYDVHRLEVGNKFILGGVEIPHEKGPSGHSDADVLIHAIIDAILGAAGLRDIGFHFPDADAELKNIDSTILLKKVCDLLKEKNYKIVNIDSTVVLELPRVNPHVPDMKTRLAGVMSITEDQISIKATTNEGMGFIGFQKGIAAYAVVLISSL